MRTGTALLFASAVSAVCKSPVAPPLPCQITRNVKENLVVLGEVAHGVQPWLVYPVFEAAKGRFNPLPVRWLQRWLVAVAIHQSEQADCVKVGTVVAVFHEMTRQRYRLRTDLFYRADFECRQGSRNVVGHPSQMGERF